MSIILKYKRVYLLGLIPISLLFIYLAKHSPFFAEIIYAKHIYRWLSQIISTITGILPFSLAEMMIIAIPVLFLVLLIRFIIIFVAEKEKRRDTVLRALLNTLCTGSVVLFLFTILAGINYYRYPFSSYSELIIQASSLEELYMLTDDLVQEANELRQQIAQTDEEGVFDLSISYYQLAKEADLAFELLAEEYPILGGYYGAPKPVLLSELMSRTEITGIFIPFTMEANVNVHVPDYSIPATMLHELAHLRGFMREDEANFLSYLAGMKSDNVEIRYSCTMLALTIAGNALYNQDYDLYAQIRKQYSEDVLKDIRANSSYWQQYEDTVVSTISKKVNDTYLKANAQTDGVKSYGRMLDLLLAKYRKEQAEQDELQ